VKANAEIKKYYSDPFNDETLLKAGATDSWHDGEFCAQLDLNKLYVIFLKKDGYLSRSYVINMTVPRNFNVSRFEHNIVLFNFKLRKIRNDEVLTINKDKSKNSIFFYDESANKFRMTKDGEEIKVKKIDAFNIGTNNSSRNTLSSQSKATVNNGKLTSAANSNLIQLPNGSSAQLMNNDTINEIDIENLKQGKWVFFGNNILDGDNSKLFEGEYLNDLKEGKWKKLFPNDTTALELDFSGNKFVGNYKMYYENGVLKSAGRWDKLQQAFKGNFKMYNPTGGLLKNFEYDDEGNKSGLQMIYYPNGNMALLANMKKGVLDGQAMLFLNNGEAYAERVYKDGKLIAEKILTKNKFEKSLADNMIQELFKPDTAVISQLQTSLKQLENMESKYAAMLDERSEQLEAANMLLSKKERDLLLKERKLSNAELRNKLQAAALSRQRNLNIFVGIISLLFLFIIAVVLKSNKQKQMANKLLAEQKAIIETKNVEITDSIEYALNIQQSILPSKLMAKELLENHFIFYQPKDIVSGDFYQLYKVQENGTDVVLIVCADCTGHGVPGALMSMLGSNMLNQIILERKITKPSLILDKLTLAVTKALNQNENRGMDGMDVAILKMASSKNTIEYAGANRPLYHLSTTQGLVEIKATKNAIGGMDENVKLFENHELMVEKGDSLYIFTDGYADQFGGPKGKKMTTTKFKNLIEAIHTKDMSEQSIEVVNYFKDWKGDKEQVDDICVIGVKI
jgi:serine phosphatase RsbU (regulator of sigma subunit)/antitoxin component YwqK of YwqJK toxin-antitoxin module